MKVPSLKIVFPLLLSFLFFLTCKTEVPKGLNINNVDKLDSILNSYVDQGFYPFVYARLEDLDGEVLYEHSRVNTQLLANTQINKDSWMRIWSMSKIITISIALDLIEEGLLKLDDPVVKYIPEFENLKVAVSEEGKLLTDYAWGNRDNACPINTVANDSVMTVLHLINHQAGFYYAVTGFECLDSMLAEKNIVSAKNNQEFINHLAELPLIQHSGSSYFYGINTTVLGFVAERASGKSLKNLVSERITHALNIKGLQYGLPTNASLVPRFTGRDSILRQAVRGELDIFGEDVPDYKVEHALYLGGEGMVATADAYTDFLRMLLKRGTLNGHRFLEEATIETIHAPHTQLDNAYGYNGYNLWVSGDSMRINGQGDEGLWIGGGYENTHFWLDPKRNFVGVIMSQNNEVRPPGYQMNDKFKGALYEAIFEEEK